MNIKLYEIWFLFWLKYRRFCYRLKARYNQIRGEAELLSFLNPQQIQEQAEKGKISFGDIVNVQLADVDVAIATALLAHQDGLFLLFDI